MMHVVRILFLICFTLSFCSAAAQDIKGAYHGTYFDEYRFENSSFIIKPISIGLHGDNEVSKGTYFLSGDTLVMDFEPFSDPPEPEFSFLRRNILKMRQEGESKKAGSAFQVIFEVNNENGDPVTPPPIVQLRDSTGYAFHGFVPDRTGRTPEIFIFGDFQGYFYFTSLANAEFPFPVDTLRGYRSTVEINLPPKYTYSTFDGIRKYILTKTGEATLQLVDVVTGQELLLKRQN